MFSDAIIVQSAISAFNNAALAAPAFLWWAILAMPVFFMAFVCGGAFMQRIGLNNQNVVKYSGPATSVMTLVWIVLFGGNYVVLRDDVSVLPFMVAAIVFVCSMFAASFMRNIPMTRLMTSRRRRSWAIALGVCGMFVLGLSDMHAWWGPLLQIGAFVLGALVGRMASCEMRPIGGTVLVVMATATAILMQPEFFRFGQLGNLSPMHLLVMLALGAAAAATIVAYNIPARGRMSDGVYVKVKWLMRFMSVLCAALFLLTESVPLFLGVSVLLGAMFALSVWHASELPATRGVQLFAIMLVLFGIITVMPAVGVMGILCWTSVHNPGFWRFLNTLL